MDIVSYFKFLTGLTPTTDQAKLLKTLTNKNINKIIISAGRQSGKTLTCAVAILWFIFESGLKIKILLLSAQDNILYFHIREIFKNHPEFEKSIVAQGVYSIVPLKGFETTNGNQVFVKGATEKQIRGIPADIVIVDEACEVKDNSILTAMGNLSGNISKFILLSTPHNKTSLFVEWATEEKPTFKIHQWSSEGLSWHSKEILKEKKKRMSKQMYAVEVLGRPPTKAERSFFTRKHISKCILDVEAIREGGPVSRLEIGLDFGMTESYTVLTLTERIGTTHRKILDIKTWKLPPQEVAKKIVNYISNVKSRFGVNSYLIKADSKPPEYKKALKKLTNKVYFLDATFHKEHMLGQLQRMIRAHNLIIPSKFVPLIKQLGRYRRGMKKGDDLVDSLAYSIYEPNELLDKQMYGRVFFPEDLK